MCGITGYWDRCGAEVTVAEHMALRIQQRGPDGAGVWLNKSGDLAMAHRRLAIMDLSPAGHQPMSSPCGRFTLVFNGEIYNHLVIRADLAQEAGHFNWRGHSDTETLLAALCHWGIERTLQRLTGMFAFALWDSQEKRLFFARDRMGEKPLYWGWCNDVLLFGSELKALKAHPAFNADVDRNALALLLRHNCIPAPHSIYAGIFKLMPGHYLSLPLADIAAAKLAKPVSYWCFNEVVEQGITNPFDGSASEAVDLLHDQLSRSVAGQMLADVPLGAFLSGGVDSSTVVALMQVQCTQKVRTFTIGSDQSSYNEAAHAKAVAQHLGTDHTELYVSPQDALDVIPRLPSMYCEPFSDSSQIPTFLVSQMARQHVTVALSGDGGDELFGGYNRYLSAQRVWSKMQRLPFFARLAVARMLRAVPPTRWDHVFHLASYLLPKRFHLARPGDQAHKLAGVLAVSDSQAFFRQLTSHWNDPASVVIGAHEPPTLLTNPEAWPNTDCFEHWMMAMDAQTFMADDILVKVDRAAMANSLETRVPMLDHRVVELAWKMPLDFKIHQGQGKWLLRQVLYKHVPKELIERPKMGFGIPLDEWLRGPLRDWAENLLDESRLRQDGYFQPAPIRSMWLDHLSERRNNQYPLWDVLMFQAWLENNR